LWELVGSEMVLGKKKKKKKKRSKITQLCEWIDELPRTGIRCLVQDDGLDNDAVEDGS